MTNYQKTVGAGVLAMASLLGSKYALDGANDLMTTRYQLREHQAGQNELLVRSGNQPGSIDEVIDSVKEAERKSLVASGASSLIYLAAMMYLAASIRKKSNGNQG